MLRQEQLSSSPASSPVIHTPDSDWVFDTFEGNEPSIWDDARSRQVRTPENLDYEVTLPPIKPKPVGIFALGGDLEDSPPELGSLFRQSHERILALQRENTVRSSTVPHDVTLLNQSGSADFQDTMVSSGAPASLFQVSDDGCYQPDIDSWCSRFSDHNPFQELPVRRGRFIQTPNGEATEKWPELNSCLQLPERHCETSENGFQMTATEPVHSDANGDGNHRCTEPRYGGNFGCADIRVRIVHDASFHSGPHFFPARFQGIIDLQVCDQSMAKHMPGWKGISNERCSLPSEPIYIYVTSDLDTVKNAAKWLFNQIHYTNTGITAYSLDMRTLSSVVELSSQFGGGGSRVDACIRWALLTAEVASLEDTLFGLHVSTRSNNSDLFVMFKNFLALNFTGEDMSSCTKMISTVAPYLPHVLFQALYSIKVARRRIVHSIIQIVEKAIDESWQEPVDVGRFHFLCALKYRFMSHSALESDSFNLCGLMYYMREVVLAQKEPYTQLFDEFKQAFASQGLSSDFSPFSLVHHY